MRYNAITKLGALIVGGILTATAIASVATPLVTHEASKGVPMTLGAYTSQRAFQGQEDTQGWDCRINGNTTCGDTWFELVCPDAPQTPDLMCALEPHHI